MPRRKSQSFGVLGGLSLAAAVALVALFYFASRSERRAPSEADSRGGQPAKPVPKAPGSDGSGLPGSGSNHGASKGPARGRNSEPPEDAFAIPTRSEAVEMRLPRIEANPEVRERGIDALVAKPDCQPPAVASSLRDDGTGGVGCYFEDSRGERVPIGRWAIRAKNGELEVGDYEGGARTGTWTRYYENGIKAAEGEYDANQREGAWDEWNPLGLHVARRRYHRGKMHGVTLRFRHGGPAVELYRDGAREPAELTP